MKDDLVQQLIARFDQLEDAIPDSMRARSMAIEVLARECLRQMQWARARAGSYGAAIAGDSEGNCDEACRRRILDSFKNGGEPVTLAPPEWKP